MSKIATFLILLVLLSSLASAIEIEITGEGDWPIPVYGAVKKDQEKKSGNTWTDRSGSANKARQQEVDIGRSDFASENASKNAEEIAKNLKNPPKTNVSLNYKKGQNTTNITITGSRGSITRVYNNSGNASEQADQILKDIATVSEGCREDTDCEDSDECTEDTCEAGICVYEIIPCGRVESALKARLGQELGIPLMESQVIRFQLKQGQLLTHAVIREGVIEDYGQEIGGETLVISLADEALVDELLASEDKLAAFNEMKKSGDLILQPIGFGNKLRFFFANMLAGVAGFFR